MIKHIPIHQQFTYKSIPRNKQLGFEIANHCNAPDRVLVVDWAGECFICSCEAWLPISMGKIEQFERLSDVWANPIAQEIQQDIQDKKYTHCAVDRCRIIDMDRVEHTHDHYSISINIDESCNLRCPSCRSGLIMLDSGPVFEEKLARVKHLVKLLEEFDEPCQIIMSGNGDPLASAIMRPLLHDFQPKPNQQFRLFTNGLLLIKQLEKSQLVPNINQYFISIDAGSADVYEKVRLGGRWSVLIENFKYLKSIIEQTKASVLLTFVLQSDNWHDMENFADLCAEFGFDGVINRLENWGTWSDFDNHDVMDPEHPDHLLALQALRKVYNREPRLQFNSSLELILKS